MASSMRARQSNESNSVRALIRPLQVGSRGKNVLRLEAKLKERRLLKGPVDEFFDARTKAAVQRFERKQDWNDDGVVGNRLWMKLLQAKATAQSAPAPQTGSADVGHFKTVNINVKSNPLMPQAQVIHDVRRASKQGSIIGWNEISPPRYFDAIRALGPEWGHYMPRDGGLRIPNPISWKKDVWKKVDAGFQQTHGGRKKVSPNRYITWVKLKHRKTGKTIIRMNTHLVSGAWTSKQKKDKPWRREMWQRHMTEMRQLVARFKAKGLPVIIGGDFNRDSYRVLGNQVRYDNNLNVATHGRSTIDYMMHTANKRVSRERAKVQGGYFSDHDAVVVGYELK